MQNVFPGCNTVVTNCVTNTQNHLTEGGGEKGAERGTSVESVRLEAKAKGTYASR